MTYYSNELYHHGIKGQKWGIRRYQNEDGSLTAAGQKRYNTLEKKWNKTYEKEIEKGNNEVGAIRKAYKKTMEKGHSISRGSALLPSTLIAMGSGALSGVLRYKGYTNVARGVSIGGVIGGSTVANSMAEQRYNEYESSFDDQQIRNIMKKAGIISVSDLALYGPNGR